MARNVFLNSACEGPGPAFADVIAAGRIEIVEEESFAGRAPDDPLYAITQFSGFFSLSECRDLLFHVQEHQFTIPQIAAFVNEAGFTFLGFELPARAAYLRRFPHDRAACDLANWAAFENDNPATFAQMYQFWIQKS